NGGVGKQLVTNFGRVHQGEQGCLVVGSGVVLWYIFAYVGTQASVLAELQELCWTSEELDSVVDLTHGRDLLRLSGTETPELLSKICALEFADDVIPDGSALRSSVAGVVTDIVRNDINGVRSYLVHCERSAGQYLWNTLLDAGAEYRIEEAGFSA